MYTHTGLERLLGLGTTRLSLHNFWIAPPQFLAKKYVSALSLPKATGIKSRGWTWSRIALSILFLFSVSALLTYNLFI